MTIPTRDELIERASQHTPSFPACADFALAEIRRAVAQIPSPEAISALEARLAAQEARIEAAKDALRFYAGDLDYGHEARAALAKMEGRS